MVRVGGLFGVVFNVWCVVVIVVFVLPWLFSCGVCWERSFAGMDYVVLYVGFGGYLSC